MNISVIIPTVGRESLKKAVESTIKALQYANISKYEVIVACDNCEVDSIEGATIIKSKGKGITAALNTGIEYAQYEWIARMDDDDVCLLKRFNHTFLYDINYAPAITNTEPTYTTGRTSINLLDYGNPICHPTVVMKKEIAKYDGPDGAEDLDLWLTLREKGATFGLYSNEPVLIYDASEKPSRKNTAKEVYKKHNIEPKLQVPEDFDSSFLVNTTTEFSDNIKWIATGYISEQDVVKAITTNTIVTSVRELKGIKEYIKDGILPIAMNDSIRPNKSLHELTLMALDGKVYLTRLNILAEYKSLELEDKRELEKLFPTIIHVSLGPFNRDNGVDEHVLNLHDVKGSQVVNIRCSLGEEPESHDSFEIFGNSLNDIAEKVNQCIKDLIRKNLISSYRAEDSKIGINSRLILHCHSINLMHRIDGSLFDKKILTVHALPFNQDLNLGLTAWENRVKEFNQADVFKEDKVVYKAIDAADEIILLSPSSVEWYKKCGFTKSYRLIPNVSALENITTIKDEHKALIIASDGVAKGWDIAKKTFENWPYKDIMSVAVVGVDKEQIHIDGLDIKYYNNMHCGDVLNLMATCKYLLNFSRAEVSPYSLLDAEALGLVIYSHSPLDIQFEKQSYSDWTSNYYKLYTDMSVFD